MTQKVKTKLNIGTKLLYSFVLAVVLVVCSVLGLAYQRQADELALTQFQIEALTASITESNAVIADLQDEIDDKTTTMDTVVAERDALQSDVTELTSDLESKQSDIADIQEQLDASESDKEILAAQIAQLDLDIADIQALLDASEGDNTELQAQLSTLTDERDTIQLNFNATLQELAGLQNQLDQALLSVESLNADIAQLNSAITAKDTTIAGLQSEINTLNSQIAGYLSTINTIKIELWNYRTLTVSDMEYTGEPLTPAVSVACGSITFTQGTDYTVAYLNNIEVGTATVTITGAGIYAESTSANFTIYTKTNINTYNVGGVFGEYSYTGNKINPVGLSVYKTQSTAPYIKYLTLGTDYTVAYSNNIEVGTATATIQGVGQYTGTVIKTYTISNYLPFLLDNGTVYLINPTSDDLIIPSTYNIATKILSAIDYDYSSYYQQAITDGLTEAQAWASARENYDMENYEWENNYPTCANYQTVVSQTETGGVFTATKTISAYVSGTENTVTKFLSGYNDGMTTSYDGYVKNLYLPNTLTELSLAESFNALQNITLYSEGIVTFQNVEMWYGNYTIYVQPDLVAQYQSLYAVWAGTGSVTFLPIGGEQGTLLDFSISDGVITGYTGSASDVIIPSTYSINVDGEVIEGTDYTVTEIGAYAFHTKLNITSITIPDSVTSIGDEAFCYCPLTSIIIPDSVTSIGYNAFRDCSQLTQVQLSSSLTTVSDCFTRCLLLTSIIIPEGITTIDCKFYGCSALTSVILSNSVTQISQNSFHNCSALASVVLTSPNRVLIHWNDVGNPNVGDDCPNLIFYVPENLLVEYQTNTPGLWTFVAIE